MNLSSEKMRKKSENTKRKSMSSRPIGKPEDPGVASAGFDDENMSEISAHNQTHQTDILLRDDQIEKASSPVFDVIRNDNKKNEEDEDDEGPEDLSWKVSEEIAIQKRVQEKEAHLENKRKEKQMRKERSERLLEQKKRKREREYSRLPVEVLQQVAKQQKSQTLEVETSGYHVTFNSSSEEEEDGEKDDEISAVKVVVMPREIRKAKKIQQSASLFLQERLFGDRVQRISAISELDRKKRRYVCEAASKFSKKHH